MSDTQCQWVPGGGPSLVQSTKSDAPGTGSPSSPRYPRHRDWRRDCMGWWLWCPVQTDRSSRRRNHVGVSPVSWSAASSNPRVWRWGLRPSGPAMPSRNKRSGPLRSMGGKVRVRPQGFSTVCQPMWLEQQWPPSGSGPERALSGGLYHGGLGWLYRPPPSVCLCGGRQLASRKAWSGLWNVSLNRQISSPCWLRKCSSSSFLPCTPSAFQQARRRALHRTVLPGRAAIFGRKENDGLQDSPRSGCLCGEGGRT